MNTIDIPLISPLHRKYFNYACDQKELKHHRAEDIRICLEKVCDDIIFNFVLPENQVNWTDYDLHEKIKASKGFLGKKVVNNLIEAKIIGNKGVHQGEEGDYSEEDIEQSLETIRHFSLAVFYSYFKKFGFVPKQPSWVPTIFSTLPPKYRIEILVEYYNNCSKDFFVIDKLAKAHLKNGDEEKAREFIIQCRDSKEISDYEYEILDGDISLLKSSISLLPIATDLETAKNNFNNLLPSINEDERDGFVCLMSMILNGNNPQ